MLSRARFATPLVLSLVPAACVWTSDGGFAQRHESSWEASVASAPGSFAGEPIVVQGEGDVTIVGVAGLDHVRVTAGFYAGANDDDDAEAAFRDVATQLSITTWQDVWLVQCNQAAADHGSAVASATGCSHMRIEVPQGTREAPLVLTASTDFGGIHLSQVVVEGLSLRAPFGLVADVVPTHGAAMEIVGDDDLVSGMCSSWLRVPSGTAFDALTMSVSQLERGYVGDDPDDPQFWLQVQLEGFDDAPKLADHTRSWSGALAGSGARVELATVHADLGKAIVTTGEVPAAAGNLCASLSLPGGWQTPE